MTSPGPIRPDLADPDRESALDRIVAEQAAYYGMTVRQHAAFMRALAILQEEAEASEEFAF